MQLRAVHFTQLRRDEAFQCKSLSLIELCERSEFGGSWASAWRHRAQFTFSVETFLVSTARFNLIKPKALLFQSMNGSEFNCGKLLSFNEIGWLFDSTRGMLQLETRLGEFNFYPFSTKLMKRRNYVATLTHISPLNGPQTHHDTTLIFAVSSISRCGIFIGFLPFFRLSGLIARPSDASWEFGIIQHFLCWVWFDCVIKICARCACDAYSAWEEKS